MTRFILSICIEKTIIIIVENKQFDDKQKESEPENTQMQKKQGEKDEKY